MNIEALTALKIPPRRAKLSTNSDARLSYMTRAQLQQRTGGSALSLDPESTAAWFSALARGRRSVRRYQERPVPRDVLHRVLEVAHWAPSNFNRQPWQFIVADSPAWCRFLCELLLTKLEEVAQGDSEDRLWHFLSHQRRWNHPLLESQALILVFIRPSPERLEQRMCEVTGASPVSRWSPDLLSAGMAVQNLLLAAHAEGLGACMHSGPVPFLDAQINDLLSLPPRLQLVGLVSLGFPSEVPEAPRRRPQSRVTRFLEGSPPEEPE